MDRRPRALCHLWVMDRLLLVQPGLGPGGDRFDLPSCPLSPPVPRGRLTHTRDANKTKGGLRVPLKEASWDALGSTEKTGLSLSPSGPVRTTEPFASLGGEYSPPDAQNGMGPVLVPSAGSSGPGVTAGSSPQRAPHPKGPGMGEKCLAAAPPATGPAKRTASPAAPPARVRGLSGSASSAEAGAGCPALSATGRARSTPTTSPRRGHGRRCHETARAV